MKNAGLSPRLSSAAEFVRWGAVFADVGTDHAYLPLFLLDKGVISRAVCSDINKGPLENAASNAKALGYFDKIDFVLTDGAEALSGFGITDLAICGMGGELIAEIISRADFLKSDNIRLILQPMSKQSYLRKYLAKEGFRIIEEKYTSEASHNYVCMLASYSGESYYVSSLEAEIGAPPYEFDENMPRQAYVKERLSALQKSANGKMLGGISDSEELKTIELIKNLLKG